MAMIVDILNQWQNAGIFDYVLPFLLVFTIVFGILEATNILGKNKGVHVIIALVVGLLGIRAVMGSPSVQDFFAQLFPRLGIGIAVLVSLLILTGLFVNKTEARFWMWGFAAVAIIVWLIVLVGSFKNIAWLGSYDFFDEYAGMIIGAVLLLGVIIAVVASKSKDSGSSGGGPSSFERQVS
jgi:hypothetical protein